LQATNLERQPLDIALSGSAGTCRRAEFAYDGGGMGKSAAVSLCAGDSKIGEGRIEHTVPVTFSSFDGLDVGLDHGAPVEFTYKPPLTFTGKLERVAIDLRRSGCPARPIMDKASPLFTRRPLHRAHHCSKGARRRTRQHTS
jgi:hypothetical protein